VSAPDPRPYAAPGDLVTAADVAAWLRERAEEEPRSTAWYLHDRLDARLDRERRQACRRGALAEWMRAADLVRSIRAYRRADRVWAECAPTLWRCLALALAFRAAARQP
jgi:hypothetical protein